MQTDIGYVLGGSQPAVLGILTLLSLYILKYLLVDSTGKYPILNPKKPFEFSNNRVVRDFIENSKHLLAKGRSLYNDKPYEAYTDWGKVLVIPPHFVESLKNNRQLEFMETAKDVSLILLPLFFLCWFISVANSSGDGSRLSRYSSDEYRSIVSTLQFQSLSRNCR